MQQSRGSVNPSLVCATALTRDDFCMDPNAEESSSKKNGALGQDEKKDETPASDAAAGGGEDAAVVVVLLLLLVGAVIGYAVFYKKRASRTHIIYNQNGVQATSGCHTPKAVTYHEPTVM